jgi:hypothetical protein
LYPRRYNHSVLLILGETGFWSSLNDKRVLKMQEGLNVGKFCVAELIIICYLPRPTQTTAKPHQWDASHGLRNIVLIEQNRKPSDGHSPNVQQSRVLQSFTTDF